MSLLTTVRIEPTIKRLGHGVPSSRAMTTTVGSKMNQVISEYPLPREEASLTGGDLRGDKLAGVSPAALDDLLHELRQPLSVIDSLAYYLELTSSDEKIAAHLQRIQAMVVQAHRVLERAGASHGALALEPSSC